LKKASLKNEMLFLALMSLVISCSEAIKVKNIPPSKEPKKPTTHKKYAIIIQPFNGISNATVSIMKNRLQEVYAGDIFINKPIELPQNTRNHTGRRYRADSLIKFLNSFVKKDQLIIGITEKDISTTKGKYPDWGIMGLGSCPGKSCIASTFRLKGKNRDEKLFKLAIHELGHTQGLAQTKTKHCPEKTCLMRAAEGRDRFDELRTFCSHCKPKLIQAGWLLK
jgi:archaemetzincin